MRKPWARSILKTCVAACMWALYTSTRKRVHIHPETQTLLAHKRPLLIGIWHGRLFLFAPFWRRQGPLPVCFIVSPHADGQVIGGAAARLGLTPIWGTRGGQGGGAEAMRQGLRALKTGSCLMITPDGPKGPRQVLGEGTAALAQLSGAPFVAITFAAKRRRMLSDQWDRSFMARLFTRLDVHVSAPTYVLKSEDRESARTRLQEIMNQQLWAADAVLGWPKIAAEKKGV